MQKCVTPAVSICSVHLPCNLGGKQMRLNITLRALFSFSFSRPAIRILVRASAKPSHSKTTYKE